MGGKTGIFLVVQVEYTVTSMEPHVAQCILSATAKALATYSGDSINVVPVSTVSIREGKIWLINYFMDKTLANILACDKVALVCWRDMNGYQIKGNAVYLTSGPVFDEAVSWVRSLLPDRVVKGLIIITPQEVYDVSPFKDTKEKFQ